MKKRTSLDMEEITRAPRDENESPPLLEIEPQNAISDWKPPPTVGRAPKDERGGKRGAIKTKTRTTYNELDPMEKIDRLRTQADNAHKRGELLFREIEEGKKAIPD